nr:biotin--[acetyl-CoA-carboxylase] ligase [Parasphingorhabdus marina]
METVAETGSTNADLKSRVQQKDPSLTEGLWLRAERQSGGKGRLGRAWESPVGNLYCSTVVDCRDTDPSPSTLSFVTALAVSDGIAAHIEPGSIKLKWPNDILVGGAKICGILLERCGDHVIVGTGVNVSVTPEVQDRQVTSLLDEGADPELSAETLLQEIAASFAQWLSLWRRDGLLPVLQEWRKRAHAEGTMLTINKHSSNSLIGSYAGLSDEGALRLRKPDGTLIEIHAGDVEIG